MKIKVKSGKEKARKKDKKERNKEGEKEENGYTVYTPRSFQIGHGY